MIITIQATQWPLAQFPIWELSMPTRDVSTDWMLILQMHGSAGWLFCLLAVGFAGWLVGLFVGCWD